MTCIPPLTPLAELIPHFKESPTRKLKIMPISNHPARSEIVRSSLHRGRALALVERDALRITGLLSEAVDTLDIQVARAQTQLAAFLRTCKSSFFRSDLQSRNLTLFTRF
jgi:hypothetical protein